MHADMDRSGGIECLELQRALQLSGAQMDLGVVAASLAASCPSAAGRSVLSEGISVADVWRTHRALRRAPRTRFDRAGVFCAGVPTSYSHAHAPTQLCRSHPHCSGRHCKAQILSSYDADGSGALEFDEFVQMRLERAVHTAEGEGALPQCAQRALRSHLLGR